MANKVKKIILYREAAAFNEAGEEVRHLGFVPDCADYVFVELRKYDEDVVLEEIVYMDGEEVFNSKRVLMQGFTNDFLNIRTAIEHFDKLLAEHFSHSALRGC